MISGKLTLLTRHKTMSCSSEDYGETKVIGLSHTSSTHFYRIRGGGSRAPPLTVRLRTDDVLYIMYAYYTSIDRSIACAKYVNSENSLKKFRIFSETNQ